MYRYLYKIVLLFAINVHKVIFAISVSDLLLLSSASSFPSNLFFAKYSVGRHLTLSRIRRSFRQRLL